MKHAHRLSLGLVLGVASVVAASQSPAIEIHNGFLTGRQFLDLPPSSRQVYVTGLVDGMFLAPMFGAPKSRIAGKEACIEGMSGEQVSEILRSHLNAKPERWHLGAHVTFFQAISERCPSQSTTSN